MKAACWRGFRRRMMNMVDLVSVEQFYVQAVSYNPSNGSEARVTLVPLTREDVAQVAAALKTLNVWGFKVEVVPNGGGRVTEFARTPQPAWKVESPRVSAAFEGLNAVLERKEKLSALGGRDWRPGTFVGREKVPSGALVPREKTTARAKA